MSPACLLKNKVKPLVRLMVVAQGGVGQLCSTYLAQGQIRAQMRAKSLHAKCSTCNKAKLDCFSLGKRHSVYRVAKNGGQKLQHCPAGCPDFQ